MASNFRIFSSPRIKRSLFVIYLFEVEVLAAIQLMWTCYTHPPIYTQRTATTPGTSSPTVAGLRTRQTPINANVSLRL